MSEYRLSKFTFEFDIDNNYIALYHSVSMEVAYIKKHLFNKMKNEIDGASYKDLIRKKFIVTDETNEDDELPKIIESLRITKPTTLRLQLTDICNLNCTYCQIEHNYKDNKGLNMSKDIVMRSLKLFAKFAPKDIQKTIILTGGEPTLNYNAIKTLFENAGELLDSYRFVLFTNGTKVTEDMAREFKKNNVLVLISLDGNEEQHDKFRIDHGGNGSFENVIEGFKTCKNAGCNIGISGVIDTHNVKELEDDILDFFMDINPDSMGLNFTHYLLKADNSKLLPMEDYADVIIKAYKKLRERGVYLENINRMIEPFVKQRIRAKDCEALGRGITVLPDGTVGVCKTLMVADIIGKHISEYEKLDNLEHDDEYIQWNKRSTYTLKCCEGCVGTSLCGTGCTYDSYVVNGNIDGVDDRACVFTKKILEFLLNDLFRIARDRDDSDIIIPTLEDRQMIYSAIELSENDLKRSAGHES